MLINNLELEIENYLIDNSNNFIKHWFDDTDGFSDTMRKVLREYVTRIHGKNKGSFEDRSRQLD